jgi:hypothetical protein
MAPAASTPHPQPHFQLLVQTLPLLLLLPACLPFCNLVQVSSGELAAGDLSSTTFFTTTYK